MKTLLLSIVKTAALSATCVLHSFAQSEYRPQASYLSGQELYATVQKFVAIGEHRTGTSVDLATSQWLKEELDKAGLKTEFTPFTLNQFFFESGKITLGKNAAEAFPLWPVNPAVNQSAQEILTDGDNEKNLQNVKGKLVLTRLPAPGGGLTDAAIKQLTKFIDAGAKGIIAVTQNSTGEIAAHNTNESVKPWKIPVWQVAPKDTALFKSAIAQALSINVEIKGASKDVTARNVVGRIGSGPQSIIISTPISGWFTCGGERGPGIAAWLALAKWVGQNVKSYPQYTFIFTGNSGHELDGEGAKIFVDKIAPKPQETKLWIHLGAAIAVKSWNVENGKYTLSEAVDGKRTIYYDESVAPAFEAAFANMEARKYKGTEANRATMKPGGEGQLYASRGYTKLVSFAYAHRYHHVKTDDARYTSPQLLEEITGALKKFLETSLK